MLLLFAGAGVEAAAGAAGAAAGAFEVLAAVHGDGMCMGTECSWGRNVHGDEMSQWGQFV